jgi:hypothetical protein
LERASAMAPHRPSPSQTMLLVLRGDTSDLFLLAGVNQWKREILIGVNQQLVGHCQSEIYNRILGSKGSHVHRQTTGGCVRLAPSSRFHTHSSSFLWSGLASVSTLMVGTQQVGGDARPKG